jgi:hypothetical protein
MAKPLDIIALRGGPCDGACFGPMARPDRYYARLGADGRARGVGEGEPGATAYVPSGRINAHGEPIYVPEGAR